MAYDAPTTVSTGQVITSTIWNQDVVNNTIFLHSPPGCRVRNTAAQNISPSTETVLNWNTEVFDVQNCFDASGLTDRLTAPVDGVYYMMGSFRYDGISASSKAWITHSGGERLFHDAVYPDAVALITGLNPAGMWLMSAGEYIRLFTYHTAVGIEAITADGGTQPSAQTFGMYWIGSGDAT